jgi:hypothetical protein
MPALIRSKNNRPREERRQNLLFLKMMFLFAGFVGGPKLGVGRERWVIYVSPQKQFVYISGSQNCIPGISVLILCNCICVGQGLR